MLKYVCNFQTKSTSKGPAAGLTMEEGREGAPTKGLQKLNPWYRGRLTTPRNYPHTLYKQWATWRM